MYYLFLFLFLISCASPKPKVEFQLLKWEEPLSLKEQKETDEEILGPPAEVDPEKLSALRSSEFKPLALDKDVPSPYEGILIDEYTAGLKVLIKAERDRRRRELIIERGARQQERDICMREINRLASRAEKNEPNWWDENKVPTVLLVGVTLGAAAAIGMAASYDWMDTP